MALGLVNTTQIPLCIKQRMTDTHTQCVTVPLQLQKREDGRKREKEGLFVINVPKAVSKVDVPQSTWKQCTRFSFHFKIAVFAF